MAFRRLSAIAGIAFVILFVAGEALSQAPPVTASAEEVIRYLTDRRDTLQVVPYVILIAGFLLVLFGAGIWAALWPSERERGEGWATLGLLGALAMAVNLSLVAAAHAVLLHSSAVLSGQPALTQVLYGLERTIGSAIDPFIALFLLGMSASGLRSATFPAWLGWLGLVGAVASLVLGLKVVGASPALDTLGLVQALAVLLWSLALSVWMLTPQRSPAAA